MNTYPFFSELINTNGKWTPPKYPTLSDPTWAQTFHAAQSDGEKRDLAHAWVWRFNESFPLASSVDDALKIMVERAGWIREIQPFIEKNTFQNSPFADVVFEHLMTYRGIPPAYERRSFLETLSKLWHGADETRLNAIFEMTEILDTLQALKINSIFSVEIAQQLAWMAIKQEPAANEKHVSEAVHLSMLAGSMSVQPERSFKDPRATAWHSLSYSLKHKRDKIERVSCDLPYDVIKQMDQRTVAKNIGRFIQNETIQEADGSCFFVSQSLLVPSLASAPTPYDVLRYYVPAQVPLWNTFESLNIGYVEAITRFLSLPEHVVEPKHALPSLGLVV